MSGPSTRRVIAEPMLVPMCDAVMTLIVIFIMTMPAVLWSGFNLDATRAAAAKKQNVKTLNKSEVKAESLYAAVSITNAGLFFNGSLTSEKKLYDQIKEWVDKIEDKKREKMIVILPDDNIIIDKVVRVFDIAQLAGADKFALLEPAKKK